MKKLFLLLIVAIVFSYAIAVPAAAAERAVFEKTWGTYGTGDGQFNHPGGIVVDASGNVYVADGWNKRIQKFTSDGIFLTKWGSNGSGDGQFTSPYGLAVDAAGNIFVADASTNERIQKFTSDGAFLAKWGKPGQVGSVKEEPGDVSFWSPSGIDIDSNGFIYVADMGNNRIQKLGADGNAIKKWGTKGTRAGEFSTPFDVAVYSENIYVTDYYNNRVQKFTSDGVFLGMWGKPGTEDGAFQYPAPIAVDALGNVFVAELNNNRIQKFTTDGKFITKWGAPGTGAGQFNQPRGMAISADGKVYVTDILNNRVQRFRIETYEPAKIPQRITKLPILKKPFVHPGEPRTNPRLRLR